MTTVIHLVRHGSHGLLDHVLCGRMEGVCLSDQGAAEARLIAPLLGPVQALYASPIQRTRETAEPLAQALGLEPRIDDDLQELDFGAWTGKRFDELHGDPAWDRWNARRSLNRPPGRRRLGLHRGGGRLGGQGPARQRHRWRGPPVIEAAMIWNEPNNKSHWDPGVDPDWSRFAALVTAGGQAIRAANPRLPRVLGGMSPIDPGFVTRLEGHGAME